MTLSGAPSSSLQFIFPFPAVTPGHIHTSKDLELGSTNKKEHTVFVILNLDYLAQSNSFYFLAI